MPTMRGTQSVDLRSVLELLRKAPGQLIETDELVDPHAELAGVYRHVGAGGTVRRPTRLGPAMVFSNVKGHPGAKVLIGLLGSRERVGLMLGVKPDRLGFLLNEAVLHPLLPVTVDNAVCQEVRHFASDPEFDIRKLVPAPTNTEVDAGPFITMGLCYASDPETGESDITIHRMCLQSKDEMSIAIIPGRHLEAFFDKAEKAGVPLPISISIGVDPAIPIGACFEPPTTPLGYDELGVAGAIRKQPVELVPCLTIAQKAIANAEYVIEGEILPGRRVKEDLNTNTGKAMPDFPGYWGLARSYQVLRVKAVTHRRNPIMQTCIGASEEHVNMAGIPTEASILQIVENAMPGRLLNVFAHSSGGGKFMAILQFKKSVASDEGRQRQAALLALAAYSELKHVIIVDDDVDPFDSNDVLWAMNTRFQADIDTVFIPGVRCHHIDPTQSVEYNPLLRDKGITCKAIFDCTVPFNLKQRFERAKFMDVDPRRFTSNGAGTVP